MGIVSSNQAESEQIAYNLGFQSALALVKLLYEEHSPRGQYEVFNAHLFYRDLKELIDAR